MREGFRGGNEGKKSVHCVLELHTSKRSKYKYCICQCKLRTFLKIQCFKYIFG